MAYIVSFRIENLAGRQGWYEATLNRDVNVFYGVNGSGKTTLLKVLHSALSTDASILKNLPFTRAEVQIYLNRHSRLFTRSFTQSDEELRVQPRELPLDLKRYPTRVARENKPVWTSDPPEPDDGRLTTQTFGFLPISRLYKSLQQDYELVQRTLSEEKLDLLFARAVQQLWTDYYADLSTKITRIQQTGLASILQFVFSGRAWTHGDTSPASTEEAFSFVRSFLTRQNALPNNFDSPQVFADKYESDAQTRSIVEQVASIERQIENITAPRERLRHLLESLFSGNKRVTFTEKEVAITLSSNTNITLPSLSSGEKQLIFICLSALSANALIIDEPELSMHVDWQIKLVTSLLQLNPKMQLILATHSPEIMADLPDSQMSSARMFLFIEAGIKYELVKASRFAASGGKSVLLRAFEHFDSSSLLFDNSPAKKWACLFFLDKDVDDVLRRSVRSLHVVYTPFYTVENALFMFGDLVKAAAAASSIDIEQIRRRVGNPDVWRRRAAETWKHFTTFCLFAQKHRLACDCTYSRSSSPIHIPAESPTDSQGVLQQLAQLESKAGYAYADFNRKWNATQRLVERLYSSGSHDVLFNGKWYMELLRREIELAASGEEYNAHAITNSIRSALTVTIDFDATWSEYFRQPLRTVLNFLRSSEITNLSQ